jgi:hypothetical protein
MWWTLSNLPELIDRGLPTERLASSGAVEE